MARDDEVALRNEDPEGEEEEADLVDPLEVLKESCSETATCKSFANKMQECTDRVNSKKKTSETCAEELIDYFHCIDNCLKDSLFTKLK